MTSPRAVTPLTEAELAEVRRRHEWAVRVMRSPFEDWAGQPEIDRARLLATLDAARPDEALRRLSEAAEKAVLSETLPSDIFTELRRALWPEHVTDDSFCLCDECLSRLAEDGV